MGLFVKPNNILPDDTPLPSVSTAPLSCTLAEAALSHSASLIKVLSNIGPDMAREGHLL